jgi:hypothetical protein
MKEAAAEKKEKVKEEEAEKKAQKQSDIKAGQKAYVDAKELVENAREYKVLKKLNEKGITGYWSGKTADWGLNPSKEAGSFSYLAKLAQGNLARFLASRPGAVALKIAAPGKPNLGSQPGFNSGLIDEGIDTIKSQFDQIKAEYKKETGKELDMTLPDFEQETSGETGKQSGKPNSKSPDDIVTLYDSHTKKSIKLKRSEAEKIKAGSA